MRSFGIVALCERRRMVAIARASTGFCGERPPSFSQRSRDSRDISEKVRSSTRSHRQASAGSAIRRLITVSPDVLVSYPKPVNTSVQCVLFSYSMYNPPYRSTVQAVG